MCERKALKVGQEGVGDDFAARVDAGPGPSAVDALVATVAAAFDDTVLTSVPEDFARLARHYRSLRVLGV